MHRKSLLIGVLLGLLLGVSVPPIVQLIGQHAASAPADRVSTASQPTHLPGELRVYPGPAICVPPEPVPRNWERRDFNGVPYYIVPLG